MILCPHCDAENKLDAAFCESCGKALPTESTGPRVITKTAMASTAAGQTLQLKELHKKAMSAAWALFAVAILQVLGGFLLLGMLGTEVIQTEEGPLDPKPIIFVQFLVAAGFFGLFIWARKSPLPAAIVGLVVFLSLVAVNALIDPTTLIQGWLVKIIVVAVLVKAISAGSQHRQLLQQMGRER